MEGLVRYLPRGQFFFLVGVVQFFNQGELPDGGIRAAVVAGYEGPACGGIFSFGVILNVMKRVFHVENFPFPFVDRGHGLIRGIDIVGAVFDSLGTIFYLQIFPVYGAVCVFGHFETSWYLTGLTGFLYCTGRISVSGD